MADRPVSSSKSCGVMNSSSGYSWMLHRVVLRCSWPNQQFSMWRSCVVEPCCHAVYKTVYNFSSTVLIREWVHWFISNSHTVARDNASDCMAETKVVCASGFFSSNIIKKKIVKKKKHQIYRSFKMLIFIASQLVREILWSNFKY